MSQLTKAEKKERYGARKRAGVCVTSASHGYAAPGHVQCERCLKRLRVGWSLNRYGLTPEARQELINKHNGVCAVCKKSDTTLCVDHNHQTLAVRGILCKKCNQALGLLQEDKNNIKALLAYLAEYEG